jgi:hypothetical protein
VIMTNGTSEDDVVEDAVATGRSTVADVIS